MMESEEQREEVRLMIRRLQVLQDSIKSHAIKAVVRNDPGLNTETGISQLRTLFDERWDLCLAIFEEAKAAGTIDLTP